MLNRLRNLFSGTRSFDGASTGRRGTAFGRMPSQPKAQLASRFELAARARYIASNNAVAAAAVDAWVSALVGSGVKPQSKHKSVRIRGRLNLGFEAWTDRADADQLSDLYGLQVVMAKRTVIDGEAFCLFLNEGNDLTVRLLDPEQIASDMTRDLPEGGRIVSGIEFDSRGRRVAYHVRRETVTTTFQYKVDRIPASDICHMFRVDTPGQVRGITWFAPVLSRIAHLDTWIDAQLTKQAAAAMLVGVVTPGEHADKEWEGEALGDSLEPGTVKVAPVGSDGITFSNPPSVGMDAIEFGRIVEREIAAGMGLPAWQVTQDLSAANYGSQRGSLIEFRRRVEQLQHGMVVFMFLRPLWNRWVATEIMTGRIKGDQTELSAAKWITPKTAWIDPKKDAEAELLAIAGGIMSRREAVTSRGVDIEALDEEIAADNERAARLGLTFQTVAANNNQQPEAAEAA
ncbi:phage portal protein [Shinella granuli]